MGYFVKATENALDITYVGDDGKHITKTVKRGDTFEFEGQFISSVNTPGEALPAEGGSAGAGYVQPPVEVEIPGEPVVTDEPAHGPEPEEGKKEDVKPAEEPVKTPAKRGPKPKPKAQDDTTK